MGARSEWGVAACVPGASRAEGRLGAATRLGAEPRRPGPLRALRPQVRVSYQKLLKGWVANKLHSK